MRLFGIIQRLCYQAVRRFSPGTFSQMPWGCLDPSTPFLHFPLQVPNAEASSPPPVCPSSPGGSSSLRRGASPSSPSSKTPPSPVGGSGGGGAGAGGGGGGGDTALCGAIRIHHALAMPAPDYTKRSNVVRLTTAEGAEFLLQAGSGQQGEDWAFKINFAAARLSAAPMAPAVGSDKGRGEKSWHRPLLPAFYTQCNTVSLAAETNHVVERVEEEEAKVGKGREARS